MSYNRPPRGRMIYWRGKGALTWRFGYVYDCKNRDLIGLGRWNGDTVGGAIVDPGEIEWKDYA